MSSNEKIDRVVQAFNLATGKDLTRGEGELFAQLLAVARDQLTYPVEQVLPEFWKKGDTVECFNSPDPKLWTPGLKYSVLKVSSSAVRLSHNGVEPEWLVLRSVHKQFKWVSRSGPKQETPVHNGGHIRALRDYILGEQPSECLVPAALLPEQWLPGDLLKYRGEGRANFSQGLLYPAMTTPGNLDGIRVCGLDGFAGTWTYGDAAKDWEWVSRP